MVSRAITMYFRILHARHFHRLSRPTDIPRIKVLFRLLDMPRQFCICAFAVLEPHHTQPQPSQQVCTEGDENPEGQDRDYLDLDFERKEGGYFGRPERREAIIVEVFEIPRGKGGRVRQQWEREEKIDLGIGDVVSGVSGSGHAIVMQISSRKAQGFACLL